MELYYFDDNMHTIYFIHTHTVKTYKNVHEFTIKRYQKKHGRDYKIRCCETIEII